MFLLQNIILWIFKFVKKIPPDRQMNQSATLIDIARRWFSWFNK